MTVTKEIVDGEIFSIESFHQRHRASQVGLVALSGHDDFGAPPVVRVKVVQEDAGLLTLPLKLGHNAVLDAIGVSMNNTNTLDVE